MLVALKAFAADQPRMAVLRFVHARGGMEQDRNVEIGDLFVERIQHLTVEIAVTPAAVEFDRFQAKFVYCAAQLFD